MPNFAERLKKSVRAIPRKHHVEYITALLSIPVLLSVIALNYFNLQNNANKNEEPAPPTNERPIIVQVTGPDDEDPMPTNAPSCRKEIGPISITSPQEGATVRSNPVCFTIKYEDENYCSVVWSYRINEGEWSDYNSSSPCVYNLPNGDVNFELRVQSTVSQDTETLERNFKFAGPTPTTTVTTLP